MPRTKEIILSLKSSDKEGMSYIQNSTLGLTYGSPRTNLGVEKADKFAFLFRQLNAE